MEEESKTKQEVSAMKHYRIKFSGFAFVEAESPDEAMHKFWDDEEGYSELSITSCEEDEV